MLYGKFFKVISAGLVLSMLIGCGNSGATSQNTPAASSKEAATSSDDNIVLTLGHVVQDGTPLDLGARKLAEIVFEKSKGHLTIEVFSNSALGGNREMIESLQMGSLDLMTPAIAPLSGFTDKTLIFDLPYLFKNAKAAEKVLDGEVGQAVLKDLESSDLIGLGWFTQSWRHLTTKNTPVNAPTDLKGLKIRVMENPMHIDHFNQLGASAISMAYSEVFTSLQQGVLDGQENPYPNIKLAGMFEVQGYLIETAHIYDPCPILFSKKTWEKLSAEDQQIIKDSVPEAIAFQRAEAERQDEAIRSEFVSGNKIQVIELTPEQRQAFMEACRPVYEKWAPKIGQDVIDSVIAQQQGM